ncbi:MAG TPA: family 16 glycoside hydrolase [Verrucomicrobiae bacterium]|jgi:Fe-S cluster assembly iron-binding protein IscA|nr:family 16 glycoside hydrolase [Verrucomicrobiae bacterium]
MFLCICLALALPAVGAELKFDFSNDIVGQAPDGFRSTVAGQGNPGEWKVIMDDVPPALAPLTPGAPVVTKRAVLAQTSRDAIDEHFPLLIYEKETFGDFTLKTKFKTVGGGMEQMAGIAFRIQDEKNFYVVRASSLGNSFRFYKVYKGQRAAPIGPAIEVTSGVWHEMTVDCKGTQIRLSLDGKEVIPQLNDTSFVQGKIGFWTKSDSISYFYDTTITYVPHVVPAQALLDATLEKYSRLLGLKIYAKDRNSDDIHLIASSTKGEVGQKGEDIEQNVLQKGAVYCGFGKESVAVVLPLRDQNGDPVAAVRIIMKTFLGQTEQNAIVRATDVIKFMQSRVHTVDDVVE